MRITDTQGKAYLDACSGAVAANLGHGLSEINDAINDQLKKVAFTHTSHGQFVFHAGKVIIVAPPFTATDDEISELFERLSKVLMTVSKRVR